MGQGGGSSDGQENSREDVGSGLNRPNSHPKTNTQEFIDAIFTRPLSLTRFDATLLTVEPRGNDWAALVFEKLEGDLKDESGKTTKVYIMGVARDGWGILNGNEWGITFSEQLGKQQSQGTPPVANW